SLIDSGYVAAIRRMQDSDCSSVLSLSEQRNLALEREHFKEKYRKLRFQRVELIGFSKSQEAYLKNFFKLEKRDGLSLDEVKKAYYQIISEDFFDEIYPRIYYDA